MNRKISENTSFTINIKTIITIGVVVFSAFGFYYKVMSDIEEAKLLPKTGNGLYSVDPQTTWPPSRNEYKMKDVMQVNQIKVLGDEIKELKQELKELREKVYEK